MTEINYSNYQNINRMVGSGSAKSVNPNNVNRSAIQNPIGADFGTLLKEQLDKNNGVSEKSLQFSKHAQERIAQRGIEITDDLMKDLNTAISKADEKGAKDVVIFDAMNAFIVNVPNKTVVTTLSGNEMRDNVFTNIDGAVIL